MWEIYKNKITAIIITFLLLVFSYILLFFNAEKLSNQSLWIAHSYNVISKLENVGSENKEMEFNYNRYINSISVLFESRFDSTIYAIDGVKSELKLLLSDNTDQLVRLKTMDSLFILKEERLIRGINEAKKLGKKINQQQQDSLINKLYIDENAGEIRTLVSEMKASEKILLEMRLNKMANFSRIIKLINAISLLIAFGFAFSTFFVYKKEYYIRKKISAESENYKQQLEARVEELKVANAEINDLQNLEKFASTGRIARTIAHEVRNPLTNINLATDQLKDISDEDEEEKDMLLGMISRNSLRINQLISNLLNATKFTELERGEESINEILDDSLALANDRIELKKINVIKNYSKTICRIKVDKEKIKIAFLNIIVNAIEAIDRDHARALSITTFQKENKCHIIITDNGSGMTEEVQSKVFEPYFTGKENGNGLGMTNTQNIILSHQGKINLKSLIGEGTTFEVILDI